MRKRRSHREWLIVAVCGMLLAGMVCRAAPEDHEIVPLFPGHNAPQRNRLNLFFIGAEYDSFNDLEKIARDLISLNGEHSDGLLQIAPFKDPDVMRLFNFWIDRRIVKTGLSYDKLTNQAVWVCLSTALNEIWGPFNREHGGKLDRGSRRICAVLLANVDPRELPDYGYGGGSFGRGATFTVWHAEHNWFSYDDMVVTHVHELVHSLPEILDEYVADRDVFDLPDWKKLDSRGQFFVPGSASDPGGISREDFLALTPDFQYDYVRRHCPWKDLIGNGYGTSGIIEAYDTRLYRMERKFEPENPTDPRANLEVGVFEGAFGCSRHAYRSVRNGIMGMPYGLKPSRDGGFGPWVERLIRDRLTAEFDDSPLP